MNGQKTMKGLLTTSITEPCGLLCCAFGVKNSAAKVYFELLEGPKTVEAIAATIERDRSVAQRYLKELVDNKEITRARWLSSYISSQFLGRNS